jgi:hypothetical protein
MRPAITRLAVLAALTCLAAAADAQTPPVALTADHVTAPDSAALAERHDVTVAAGHSAGLDLARPITKVTRTTGGETRSLPDSAASLDAVCDGPKPWPAKLAANQSCQIGVTLGAMREPGQYKVRMILRGGAGGRHEVNLGFAHRRPLGWPIALVALGLLTGGLITWWRGSGRDRTRTAIRIKGAVEALKGLDAGPPNRPRIKRIFDVAAAMEADVLRNEPVEDAQIVELRRRVPQYRFLRDLESMVPPKTDPAKRVAFDQAVADAISKMLPGADDRFGPVPDSVFQAVQDELAKLKPAPLQADADSPIPIDSLPLPITAGMTGAAARRVMTLMDWLVAIVLMAIFIWTAMGTLYFGKPYWGSNGDLLAAFMVGFGAFAGAVASVDTFLQRARATS